MNRITKWLSRESILPLSKHYPDCILVEENGLWAIFLKDKAPKVKNRILNLLPKKREGISILKSMEQLF